MGEGSFVHKKHTVWMSRFRQKATKDKLLRAVRCGSFVVRFFLVFQHFISGWCSLHVWVLSQQFVCMHPGVLPSDNALHECT